jgi:GTP cyclohydrolase I
LDKQKIEEGIRLILEGIGEDIKREGIIDTPRRVASMYEDILSGIAQDPYSVIKEIPTDFSSNKENTLISIKDIKFYSLCEHHLLPFFGKVDIFYLPTPGKIVGLSKIAKVVDILSKRLQVQERLTWQIADVLMDKLQPKGLYVKVKAEHLCLSMRGVKKEDAVIITTAKRGTFKY